MSDVPEDNIVCTLETDFPPRMEEHISFMKPVRGFTSWRVGLVVHEIDADTGEQSPIIVIFPVEKNGKPMGRSGGVMDRLMKMLEEGEDDEE